MAGPITIRMDTIIRHADLDRLIAVVRPRAVLKVIGLRLMTFVDESFETRGRGGWKPLSQITLFMRQRGGDAPLQDTGRYKQSFSGQEDGFPLYSRPAPETDNATYIEIGTNVKTASGVPLGPIHEHGTGPFLIPRNGPSTAKHGLIARTRSGTWIPFGRRVQHPGIPARPALPTVRQAEMVLKPVLEGMLQRAIDGSD